MWSSIFYESKCANGTPSTIVQSLTNDGVMQTADERRKFQAFCLRKQLPFPASIYPAYTGGPELCSHLDLCLLYTKKSRFPAVMYRMYRLYRSRPTLLLQVLTASKCCTGDRPA